LSAIEKASLRLMQLDLESNLRPLRLISWLMPDNTMSTEIGFVIDIGLQQT